MRKITYLILLMVVACSKNLSSPQNNAPTINSFAVNRVSGPVPLQVNFTWSVYDIDGDTVNCYLDVNGDGVAEQVINNCSNASFSWIYNDSKIYNATLTVFDKYGASSSKSITIRACKVLYNGSVSVPANSSVQVSSFIANQGDTLYIKAFVQSDTVINYIKVTNVVSTIDSVANSQTISRTIAIPEYREYRIIAGNTSTSAKTYYIRATLNDVNCQ